MIAIFPTAKSSVARSRIPSRATSLFNAPTIYQGIGFDNIRLEFRDGKIVKATSNQTEKLNKILDSDPGSALHRGIFARL